MTRIVVGLLASALLTSATNASDVDVVMTPLPASQVEGGNNANSNGTPNSESNGGDCEFLADFLETLPGTFDCSCNLTDEDVAFGCDSTKSMEPICDEKGCIERMNFHMTVPFEDSGDTTMESCVGFGEDVTEGLENTDVCFYAVLSGENDSKIKSCRARIGDDECGCTVVDDGNEVEFDCGEHSDVCTGIMENNQVGAGIMPGVGMPRFSSRGNEDDVKNDVRSSISGSEGYQSPEYASLRGSSIQ
uniref:Uncharacterized protein n=1 Tax=Trieres chinensis TaxID=1514140 RepID=A0A7S1Z0T1_TRICV|mmetsp:Transcript_15162/g.30992  ORF Transcript_15162/g.30992 Transcript_15162/m.30992 type:complete len:247 (+) Transcript_15162:167-907(+)|eukprot:CAMPEP_0183309008 /NCGR_PEP_ID=MMETSP0160_2-20130417/23442_1 /TAXON_ID=2839 ORGANISM="Odontella Sinensis, Strain Grunow 1884" /NCGR_SAMPLE_ID=MMETSP0160_2 /ASSEMBLY_ACC=CAM_ASM_000250 /LENGTH=246 /DNA_ID=CAMNT_0025472941 /DNA_START=163 /DNA_END=903 /DNA_ORIENTATION=-